jgi:hypothetical protein
MKVLQPLNDNVAPDPVPERTSEIARNPEVAESSTVSAGSISYQPWNHELSRANDAQTPANTPAYKKPSAPTLNSRLETYARHDAVATWLIIIVGLLIIGQAAVSLVQVFTHSTDSDTNGFAGIVYSLQALLGLGFVFRVDMARRALLWFTALILAFNLYTFLMTAGVIFIFMQTTAGFITGVLSILTQLLFPIAVLTVLNLRSVKSSFGQ